MQKTDYGRISRIEYSPHEGQERFHNSTARFRLMVCGIRGGKTWAGAMESIMYTMELPKMRAAEKRAKGLRPRMCYGLIMGPTYSILEHSSLVAFNQFCPDGIITAHNRQKNYIETSVGTTIFLRSAQEPDSIRGLTPDWIWVDELAMCSESLFPIVRGRLISTEGWFWGTTTPQGKNWLKRLYDETGNGRDPDFEWFFWKTTDNPALSQAEILEARRHMSEDQARQELDAEFVDSSGSVFRSYEKCVDTSMQRLPGEAFFQFAPPEPGHTYVMGLDFARKRDYTVAMVIDETTRTVVAWDRFTGADWGLQLGRIMRLLRIYGYPRCVADEAGAGDPIIQSLANEGFDVEGIQFRGRKPQIIQHLSLLFDYGPDSPMGIRIPYDDQLDRELRLYEYDTTESGNIKYDAPSGEHDDMVIALALAAWHLDNYIRIVPISEYMTNWRPFSAVTYDLGWGM